MKIFNATITTIALVASIVVLAPKAKAAEFRWHTDRSGRESGYVCADTSWGIRDGVGRVVGILAPKECMKVKDYRLGSGFLTVEGGKSGLNRILWLDKVSETKAHSFWYGCSDQTIDAQNKGRNR